MNWIIAGFLIAFAAYAANRFVMTAATKKLDDSMKLKLFDAFSVRNNYGTFFILALVLIYFAAMQIVPENLYRLTVIYLIVYIAYFVLRFVSNYKKLKQLQMPFDYIKNFVLSYMIFASGFLIMVFCILQSWFE